MKRKTNLFYTEGPDSKFLTFSNYTEYLTGNYLSPDYKLFPSNFICLYIPSLNTENNKTDADEKTNFILNWLSGYYENKLAVLRDYCLRSDRNYNVETNVNPLSYLLNVLLKYDSNIEISYIGSITEQNYNGTYTDSICIVDGNDCKTGQILDNDTEVNTTDDDGTTPDYGNILYGWEYDVLPDNYKNVSPQYDLNSASYYKLKSDTYIGYNNDNTITEIKFNCIIPLFDIVNINIQTNQTTIDINNNSEYTQSIKFNYQNNHISNIPYGIWISDELITLNKNVNTINQFPVWSLVISSQFKALPYFKGIDYMSNVNEQDYTNNAYNNSFATFAQVLSRQNTIMNIFNQFIIDFKRLSEDVQSLKTQISNISTVNSIDELNSKIVKEHNEMKEEMETFKSYIEDSILGNLKWKVAN